MVDMDALTETARAQTTDPHVRVDADADGAGAGAGVAIPDANADAGLRSNADHSDPSGDRALAPYVPRLVIDWLHSSQPERELLEVRGTVMFADISGFTALTERLAQRGKAGA